MALQKCPELVCIPPDFPLYSRSSEKMFQLLGEYSDRIEQFSIDEGFLEYTGMEALLGPSPGSRQNYPTAHLYRTWLYSQHRHQLQ